MRRNKIVKVSERRNATSSQGNKDKAIPKHNSYLVKAYGMSANKSDIKDAGNSIDEFLKSEEVISEERLEIYQQAEMLIQQINSGTYSVGRLATSQKKALFYYLSIFSPIISRVIDLHTKLPLSTLRLQKPKHDIDIVQDYVYDYFNKFVNTEKFKSELRNIIRNRWIFGLGVARIEDDYEQTRDTVSTNDLRKITLPEPDAEKLKEYENLNNKYNTDPDSVTWKEKLKVLKGYILNINPDYEGIINFKSINVLDIEEVNINSDIDYHIYTVPASDAIRDFLSDKLAGSKDYQKAVKLLKKMGYSEGLIQVNMESDNGFVEIDNDPYNEDGVYVVYLSADNESITLNDSLLNRVLEPAIRNLSAIRTSNNLFTLASKIDRIVSAPNASLAQLETLQTDLATMAESEEGSMLAVNYEVSVEELSLDIGDQLDLDSTIERTEKEILSALGMPDDIISGEGGSYGGSFLKVELLSNEYIEFRNSLKGFIEDQIFKPIAIKKGFITVNSWGDVIPIIPSVRFDKFSISRQSEDLAMIRDLVAEKKLPVETLLEHLGFNVEDIEQKLRKEQSTILNPDVHEAINTAIQDILTEKLGGDSDFIKKLLDSLGFTPNVDTNKSEESEDK